MRVVRRGDSTNARAQLRSARRGTRWWRGAAGHVALRHLHCVVDLLLRPPLHTLTAVRRVTTLCCAFPDTIVCEQCLIICLNQDGSRWGVLSPVVARKAFVFRRELSGACAPAPRARAPAPGALGAAGLRGGWCPGARSADRRPGHRSWRAGLGRPAIRTERTVAVSRPL